MANHNDDLTSHISHSYGRYILVWMGLLTLTAITVAVAGVNLGDVTIAMAIVIASIKSYLVITEFMHLNTESRTFKVFIGVALFFIIITLVLLFSDYSKMQGLIK
jgi:cytochrome c oxidase subunit 4